MSTDNYRWYLQETLRSASDLLPERRAQASYDLLIDQQHSAHRLTAFIGAAESLVRSILRWRGGVTYDYGSPLGATHLIEVLLSEDGSSPIEVFDSEDWDKFQYAVEYSDVIRKECLPLRPDYCLSLIDVTAKVVTTIMQRYNIPLPVTNSTAIPSNEDETGPADFKAVDGMLKEMFGWSERITSLLISAGYVGFLAVWTFMHDRMGPATELSVALLFVVSLACYSFWHAFNILRMNRAAVAFRAEAKVPGGFSKAMEKFSEQVGNPHKPFDSFWVNRVLPFTVITALLGAAIMVSAFVHGLLVTFGCHLPVCRA